MSTVELQEELHSNTRRTRITFRGRVDGQSVAIKCYRKPLFGVIHWMRALYRGKKIRRAGAPVPPICYSGWVSRMSCFGYATGYLEGYLPLRDILYQATDKQEQAEMLGRLGAVVARLHELGLEQADGNLTNFLVGPGRVFQVVDEDDISVSSRPLLAKQRVRNLADIVARVEDEELADTVVQSYLRNANIDNSVLAAMDFRVLLQEKRELFKAKRVSRGINSSRPFD